MSVLSFFGLSPRPSDDFWYGAPGSQTVAGVRVDETIAFNYSVCWAATRLLAGTSGWLPFNLYRRLPNGGAEIDKEHPVHRLIHDQPNDDMGAMMFRSRGVNHQVNWGNTFAEIVRNRAGVPIALEPIHPSRIPSHNIRRENGALVYYVKQPDGSTPVRIKREDMFHVPSIISDDGVIGKGVVTAARESIGKAMSTQRHGAAALNHGGAPPLALKGGKFKDKAELEDYRRQINEAHGGAENAGKWLLLPEGSEVQMLGFSLKDAQFIESQQFDIEEMSRWYGVPPHLVGHLLRATFNNIEELGISFVKYSLILWLKLWEQEVWRKLLTKQEQKTHYAKFVVDALERGNLATRTEAGVKKFFNGLFTLNQWAEQEDMNPITETVVIDGQSVNLGDMHFVQQAMVPLSMAAKGQAQQGDQSDKEPPTDDPPDDPTPDADLAAAMSELLASNQQATERLIADLRAEGQQAQQEFMRLVSDSESTNSQLLEAATAWREQHTRLARALLRDVMSRALSAEIHRVKHIAEKPDGFTKRLNEFYAQHVAVLERSLAEPVAVCLAAMSDSRAAADVVHAIAAEHVAESQRQLDAVFDGTVEGLPGRVEACVSKWHDERATVTL